jgi:hypothetical protein
MYSNSKLRWLGSEDKSLDKCTLRECGDITLGYYGGNTESGAYKNEDGAYILSSKEENWKLAMILDSHGTNESAMLVLKTVEQKEECLKHILNKPTKNMLSEIHKFFTDIFESESFKAECRNIKGETACLIVVQKEQYLWWMSIGDNLVYLFHPELAELNQFALNQRQFYEWVGEVNTFELEIPCYSVGTRLLREHTNYIYLVTDGVLECGQRPFESPKYLYNILTKEETKHNNVLEVLGRVHLEKGRDSATIIGWSYFNNQTAPRPSA